MGRPMSAVEPPSSAHRAPDRLDPPAADDVCWRASAVLGEQPWLDGGRLRWFGWGGPSTELEASMPGRWVAAPDQAVDTEVAVGAHLMIDRLPPDRPERLERLTRLWDGVRADGHLALTVPVHAGSGCVAAGSFEADVIPVDHRRLIEELLEATAGRVLTQDVVVHHPETATAMTWATIVLRCLR